MLRSVQRLERRGGFRPRLFDGRNREHLECQAIARIQGAEGEAPEARESHERLERLVRYAVHGAGEGLE